VFHLTERLFIRFSNNYNYTDMADLSLVEELKIKIIKALNLEEMTPEQINPEEPLFGEGLGLDSIDALELIVMLEKDYGIKIKNQAEGKEVFISISSMAEYIRTHRTK